MLVIMTKDNYLNNATVLHFTEWIAPKISQSDNFIHHYIIARNNQQWNCNSIYNAYELYNWNFQCSLPGEGFVIGNTYQENSAILKSISNGLQQSLQNQDQVGLLAYCNSVLKWGGVTRGNAERLRQMGDGIVPYFESAINSLNPETTNTEQDFGDIHMNAGFSKIYSLMIDQFIIYDSRVGAALGLLVKQYLTDRNSDQIPDVLHFAYANARPTQADAGLINRRNPSNNRYTFQALNNNPARHIRNNLHANWLLKEISQQTMFNQTDNPIRALESALFMIGYSVRE